MAAAFGLTLFKIHMDDQCHLVAPIAHGCAIMDSTNLGQKRVRKKNQSKFLTAKTWVCSVPSISLIVMWG